MAPTLSLSQLLARLLPDPIEDLLGPQLTAVDDLDLEAAVAQFGDHIKPALYAYLCDPNSRRRAPVLKALDKGVDAAVAVLAPQLVKQFKLPARTARTVAAFIIRALALRGRGRLCGELEKELGPLPKPRRPKRKPAAKKPAPRQTAKRRPRGGG